MGKKQSSLITHMALALDYKVILDFIVDALGDKIIGVLIQKFIILIILN